MPGPRWRDTWRRLEHHPEAVIAARHRLDWNQSKLAHELGISRSYLCEIESGKRNANSKLLHRMATLFGCTATDLAAREIHPADQADTGTEKSTDGETDD